MSEMKEINTELLHDLSNIAHRLSTLIDLYREEDLNDQQFHEFMDEIKQQVQDAWP